MQLFDYLGQNTKSRRILVVSNRSKELKLKRRYEKITGKTVINVEMMTLDQIAQQIFLYEMAKTSYALEAIFMNRQAATVLLRDVILEEIKKESLSYFTDEKMMTFSVVGEILSKMNLVRANGWKTDETADSMIQKNPRLQDLDILISAFQEKMRMEVKLDQIAVMQFVVEAMGKWTAPKDTLIEIFDADFASLVEETEKYTKLEKNFLTLLCDGENDAEKEVTFFKEASATVNGTGGNRSAEISFEKISPADLENCKGKSQFFRAYGQVNQINYIVNDIMKKGIPFGQVEILCTGNNQLAEVASAFGGRSIPVRVLSNMPVADNAYVSPAKRCLDWAENDFSEKKLEAIMNSRVVSVSSGNKVSEDVNKDAGIDTNKDAESDPGKATNKVASGKARKKNLIAGQKYFRHVLETEQGFDEDKKILGWGYKWNFDFIDFVRNQVNEKLKNTEDLEAYEIRDLEEKLPILDFHQELLSVFGDKKDAYEKVSPFVIYEKLCDFMKVYTVKGKDKAVGIGALNELKKVIRCEDRCLPMGDALKFIHEQMDQMTKSDSEDSKAVSVQVLNDWTVLERKYVYLIGLSLMEMAGNTTESPVMLDVEMQEKLQGDYVPTIEVKAQEKEEAIFRTLASFDGEEITFGYAFFDTVESCDRNASNIFYELLEALSDKSMDQLPDFVYGNPEKVLKVEGDMVLSSIMKNLEEDHESEDEEKSDLGQRGLSDGQKDLTEQELKDTEEIQEESQAGNEEAEESGKQVGESNTTSDDAAKDAQDANGRDEVREKKSSPTRLEKLITCPRSYKFSMEYKLPTGDYFEKNPDQWLPPTDRGSLFHEAAEVYMEKYMILPSSQAYQLPCDEKLVDSTFAKIQGKYEKIVPAAYPQVIKEAMDDQKEKTKAHLNWMLKRMQPGGEDDGWRVLKTEQEFHYAEDVEDYLGNKHRFLFHGFVDRIDYKIDEDAKEIIFRIADYKTGQKKYKVPELKQGHLMQCLLYRNAVMTDEVFRELCQVIADKKLEKVTIDDSWKRSFDSFLYVFPLEHEKNYAFKIEDEELNAVNVIRLKWVLTYLEEKKSYPDVQTFLEYLEGLEEDRFSQEAMADAARLLSVMEKTTKEGPIVGQLSNEEKGSCRYCKFVNLCDRKRKGEF